jgi:hypothetical protein
LKAGSSYHLHLDTHISTAFVAGYFIQTEKRKYKIILNGAAAVASFLFIDLLRNENLVLIGPCLFHLSAHICLFGQKTTKNYLGIYQAVF